MSLEIFKEETSKPIHERIITFLSIFALMVGATIVAYVLILTRAYIPVIIFALPLLTTSLWMKRNRTKIKESAGTEVVKPKAEERAETEVKKKLVILNGIFSRLELFQLLFQCRRSITYTYLGDILATLHALLKLPLPVFILFLKLLISFFLDFPPAI